MSIIIKFIFKSIIEKKLRTFLMVFSIMISTALFLASLSASENMGKMAEERAKSYVGMAEILIYAGDKSPSRFLNSSGAFSLKEHMEFISEAFVVYGSYKHRKGKDIETADFELGGLDGIDPDTLKKTGRIKIAEERDLFPFEGNKIIIGSASAKKYGLKLGETIGIFIDGTKHRFLISGIAEQAGIYLEDGFSNRITVPIDTLRGIYGLRGKATHLLIKPKIPGEKQKWINELSELYENYVVKETITEQDLEEAVKGVTVPLALALILVVLISLFIIYVSFKVITAERLPLIGTFRSIGASKAITDFVIFAESLAYGVAGGITGCMLGTLLVYIIVGMLGKGGRGTVTDFGIVINPVHVVFSFILAVVLSLVSSAVPIIKVSKISVKDIVLNKVESIKRYSTWKPVLGIVFLIFTFAAPYYVKSDTALLIGLLCLVLVSVSMITFIPLLTAAMVKIFERLYLKLFGNIGILSAKNLRDNKSNLTNITLLSIGIGALLMIFTVSFTAFESITGTYKDAKFDIFIAYMNGQNREAVGQIMAIDGIREAYGLYSAEDVEVTGSKERIVEIMGVDKSRFAEYFDMHCQGDERKMYEELEQGRNILLSGTLKRILNVEAGDSIRLRTKRGSVVYKVTGFYKSTWQNGRTALVAEKHVKMDFSLKTFNTIFAKTSGNTESVLDTLKKRFQDREFYGYTKQSFEDIDNREFGPIIMLMKGFSVMAMLIGVFGVLNNFAISFLERKRSIAMMKAVGLSRMQTAYMILIEALTVGLIGGMIGVVVGGLSARLIPVVLMATNLPEIKMSYSPLMFVQFILCGIFVTVVASVSPALKSSRLNIIEAIKYE